MTNVHTCITGCLLVAALFNIGDSFYPACCWGWRYHDGVHDWRVSQIIGVIVYMHSPGFLAVTFLNIWNARQSALSSRCWKIVRVHEVVGEAPRVTCDMLTRQVHSRHVSRTWSTKVLYRNPNWITICAVEYTICVTMSSEGRGTVDITKRHISRGDGPCTSSSVPATVSVVLSVSSGLVNRGWSIVISGTGRAGSGRGLAAVWRPGIKLAVGNVHSWRQSCVKFHIVYVQLATPKYFAESRQASREGQSMSMTCFGRLGPSAVQHLS